MKKVHRYAIQPHQQMQNLRTPPTPQKIPQESPGWQTQDLMPHNGAQALPGKVPKSIVYELPAPVGGAFELDGGDIPVHKPA